MKEAVGSWPRRRDGSDCTAGTTAVVCLLRELRLFVAHVGDSRAVLASGGRAQSLTVDHRLDHARVSGEWVSVGGGMPFVKGGEWVSVGGGMPFVKGGAWVSVGGGMPFVKGRA